MRNGKSESAKGRRGSGGKLSQVGVSVCGKTGIVSRVNGGLREGERGGELEKNESQSVKTINSKPFDKLSARRV